jgi:hypothetical protein
MPGIVAILLRGSGKAYPWVRLSLTSLIRRSCCFTVPLWLPKMVASWTSFSHSGSFRGAKGQLDPKVRTVFIQLQLR